MPTLSASGFLRRLIHRCFAVRLSTFALTLGLSAAILFPSTLSAAQDAKKDLPPTPKYRIEAATGPIEVDGLLDDPAWADALLVDRFWEWFPGENVEPPVRTEIRLTYDENALYVGAMAFDPEPSKIRAHLMARDEIDQLVRDDYIIVQLDTFNDERRSLQFRINPLGVQADALNSSLDFSEDWSWDLIWDSRGRILENGYSVEIAIPFSQLPFAQTDGEQTWRVNVGRSYPRDQRHRIASFPTDYDVNCGSCLFNEVTGFEGLVAGRRLQFTPTVVGARTDTRDDFPDGELQSGDEDFEAGVQGSWGITPSTRLSFAVNPDFSQVEADAAQLDVNERFALFFPEQRPFFLEDVDFFRTPLQAVFTRTVADPDWGLKLTSKQGKNAWGVVATQDQVNNVLLPGNQGSRFASSADGLLDDEVLGSVLRYRRDVGDGSSLGVLYTGREGDDYFNRVGGVDGLWRLTPSDQIRFQVLHSQTEYPRPLREREGLEDETLAGEAFSLRYNHFTRHWNWSIGGSRLDSAFRADSGFVPRVDVAEMSGELRRTWWPEDAFLTQISTGLNLSQTEDTSGRRTDSKIGLTTFLQGPKQSELFAQVFQIDKRNGPTLYEDLQGGEVFVGMQPNGSVQLEFYVSYEDEVDFANDRRIDLLQVSPEINLRLGRRVSAEIDHFYRGFENESGTYLKAHLTELRLFYHFNVRSYLRAVIQRTDISNDPTQFRRPVEREIEDVFTQLLYSYRLNAQTVLFAGYSESRIAGDAFSLTQADRTLFLKVGYAFLY